MVSTIGYSASGTSGSSSAVSPRGSGITGENLLKLRRTNGTLDLVGGKMELWNALEQPDPWSILANLLYWTMLIVILAGVLAVVGYGVFEADPLVPGQDTKAVMVKLLIAASPAFLSGIVEDLTKAVAPRPAARAATRSRAGSPRPSSSASCLSGPSHTRGPLLRVGSSPGVTSAWSRLP